MMNEPETSGSSGDPVRLDTDETEPLAVGAAESASSYCSPELDAGFLKPQGGGRFKRFRDKKRDRRSKFGVWGRGAGRPEK